MAAISCGYFRIQFRVPRHLVRVRAMHSLPMLGLTCFQCAYQKTIQQGRRRPRPQMP